MGDELTVDSPPLRAYYLSQGYAWLASSYSANFYDVRAGVESTNSLVRYFKANVGDPRPNLHHGLLDGWRSLSQVGHIAPEFGRPDNVLLGRGCENPALITYPQI
jgi:hypothetical protein